MIRASDLVGAAVFTESGEKLGHVHDLRAHFDGESWRLMGLVLGAKGLRERLVGADEEGLRGGQVVAWEAVVGIDDGVVTVRDVIAAAPS
jgi:sporulation protein YlmC with PRC-barrel domain